MYSCPQQLVEHANQLKKTNKQTKKKNKLNTSLHNAQQLNIVYFTGKPVKIDIQVIFHTFLSVFLKYCFTLMTSETIAQP